LKSWQKRERGDVPWAYDPEVAVVHSREVGDVEALGGGDDRRVDGPEREIPIRRDEFGDSQPVTGRNGLDRERPGGEIAEEADLGFGAQARPQEVSDLRHDEDWDDQRTRVGLEQFKRCVMMGVVAIDVGVQRPSIDEQGRYR
jgi:hypothetical protein